MKRTIHSLLLTVFVLIQFPVLAAGSAAIDVLFISSAHSNKSKVKLLKKAANEHALNWNISQKSARSFKKPEQAFAEISKFDFVVLDGVSSRESKSTYENYLPFIAQVKSKVLAPNWLTEQAAQNGLSELQQKTLAQYWKNAGRANLSNMLSFIAKDVLNAPQTAAISYESPIIFPNKGLYHPSYQNLIVKDLETFLAWQGAGKEKLKVALLFNRSSIETESTELIDATIREIEKRNAIAVPFFFKMARGALNYDELLYLPGSDKPDVDLIVNFRNIHWANKRKQEFEKLGIPVVQASNYYSGNKKAWEDSEEGIGSGMMAFSVVLPESAGVIDPIVVSAMDRVEQKLEIIDYQLEFLVERALNYAVLNKKPNSEKRLTTMFWGDRDMGASFLNVPESLEAISYRLNDEGYSIDKLEAQYFIDRVNRILNPFYRDFELDSLLADDLAELLPVEDYKNWLATIPNEIVQGINEHWGQPEDNFMVVERNGQLSFIIPRIRNGNMLVLRQPPRGDSKDKEQGLYHDTKVPMNHYYLAAYFYAREYWNSDAFIHLGTHGTHEYLPGKDRGLSRYDGANLSTGTLPVIYPYIVDDVGEAMQAKRRGNAITVGHMTPPFAAAGLQGVTADMHTLVDQYRHIDTGGVKEKTKQHIIDFCIKENLCKDLHYDIETINADFDVFLEDLHSYLEELASANQPLGLHSFGELPEQRLVISTLGQMLGNEFLVAASKFEKERYEDEGSHHHHDHDDGGDSDKEDHEHDEAHKDGHEEINDGLMHIVDEDLENTAGYKTLRDYVVGTADGEKGDMDDLTDELMPFIKQAQKHYAAITGIKELDNLVGGLSSKFIAPKNGGDPVRNPDSLPTGFNLIGFDPSRLPTKAAYEQGVELTKDVINTYYNKHGEYPDKLAFSLWSVEAMRHYGVLESQALYAMGLRPVWTPDGRVRGTEIIPYSELGRPRVDVVLSATGLYRDAFPNVMLMLAKAIKQLSELKEESNPIWRNSLKVKEQLMAEGMEEDEAVYLSSVRIFSNDFGDYGSGVDEPIMQSDTWESDKKIADNYLATMGKHFGADKSKWGQTANNLYAKQLSGTDVAMFARSSNLYGMITSDDPFEYFGSLALAVRNIDGKSPEMIISNLRNAKKGKMELAADMLAKELRTRNFHKRWITEMQKEGYSGAVTMAGNLNNFWGWQVVDPDVVRNDQWDEFVDIYVNDKLELGLDEWFEEVNPGALAQMMERMLEANRKDYWETSPERLKQLVEKYSEMLNKYDLFVDNEKLKEHVNELAKGFGLAAPNFSTSAAQLAADAVSQQQNPAQPTQQVEGQKLEEQKQNQDVIEDNTIWYSIAGLMMIFLFGFLYEAVLARPKFQVN